MKRIFLLGTLFISTMLYSQSTYEISTYVEVKESCDIKPHTKYKDSNSLQLDGYFVKSQRTLTSNRKYKNFTLVDFYYINEEGNNKIIFGLLKRKCDLVELKNPEAVSIKTGSGAFRVKN